MFGPDAMRVLAGELAAEGVDLSSITIAEADEKLARIEREKRTRLRIYQP